MSAKRTDMDRLLELVRLHRMGTGSRSTNPSNAYASPSTVERPRPAERSAERRRDVCLEARLIP